MSFSFCITMATIEINKEAIKDLVRVKNEFDSIIESLELMSNPEFIASYEKSKEQVKKRDFDIMGIKRGLKDAAQGNLTER